MNKKIKELFLIEKGSLQSLKNTDGEFDFVTASQEWKKHNSCSHDCEAIIIAVGASGSLGRTHYINGKFIASDLCFILTPLLELKKNIDLRFYYHYFIWIRERLVKKLAKGAAKKAINKGNFSNFEIPYPTVHEQREISNELDKVFNFKKELDGILGKSFNNNSLFEQKITDKAILNKGNKYDIYDIAELLKRNKTITSIQNDVIYKRTTIKMHGKGIKIRDELKGIKIATKRQYLISNGQFMLSKIDARNGAFGIVPKECNGAIVTADFLAYDINTKLILPEFFNNILKSKEFLDLFIKSSQGMTNRKRVKESVFLKMKITLPSKSHQQKLIEIFKQSNELNTNFNNISKKLLLIVTLFFNRKFNEYVTI